MGWKDRTCGDNGEKRCSKCNRCCPTEDFNYTSRHGVRYKRANCKKCQALQAASWHIRVRCKPWYRKHKKLYMRRWLEENRKRINARRRQRYRKWVWKHVIGSEKPIRRRKHEQQSA